MMKRIFVALLALAMMLPVCCSGEAAEAFDDRLTIVAMLGEESDFIYSVECALCEKGYLAEDYVDGYFDTNTELAVMNFQYAKGYYADGMLSKVQFYWLSRKYYNNWFDSSNIAWITPTGTRYHTYECTSLQYSTCLMPISVNIAYGLGYVPCRLCNPY